MTTLQGRRVAPDGSADVDPTVGYPRMPEFEPGDYLLLNVKGRPELWFRDPVGNIGRVTKHTITEHEDGTVSVEPSIADEGEGSWHGWLRKGVWEW